MYIRMFSKTWFKYALAVVLMSLLIFYMVYLSDISPGTKYKIYVMQFNLLFTLGLLLLTKYFWKCLVTELMCNVTNTYVLLTWKSFLIFFFTLSHCAQFTNLYGYEEPSFSQWISWVFFGYYSILMVILPPARFIFWIFTKTKQQNGVVTSNHVTIMCVVVTFMVSVSSYFAAMNCPEIVKVTIPVKGMHRSLDGMRIALLADVHIGPTVGISSVEKMVEMTNSLDADFIAVVGDLVDTKVRYAKDSVSPLKNMKAKHGKYFTTGNHEYYTGEVDEWFTELASLGFTILHNSNTKIQYSSDEWFCLIGTDDIQADQLSYGDHGMDLASAFDGCQNDRLNILLAHQPNAAETALYDSRYTIQLILSGHTHGGQLYTDALPMYLSNAYYRGLYQVQSKHVYVSQGTFYFGVPMRWGSRCEITDITLKAV